MMSNNHHITVKSGKNEDLHQTFLLHAAWLDQILASPDTLDSLRPPVKQGRKIILFNFWTIALVIYSFSFFLKTLALLVQEL